MSEAGAYRGDGWCHWPSQPQASALLTRVLGGASLGAGSVGECLQAASRIDPADPSSWNREWLGLATRVRDQAAAAAGAGRTQTARAMYLRAAAYFRAAEYLLLPASAERQRVYTDGADCTRLWAGLSGGSAQRVEMALPGGGAVFAYFVAPAAAAPWPAAVVFGGLDAGKEEMLPRVARHAAERGIALLVVDLPGQGETRHRSGLTFRDGVETAVCACADWLVGRRDIDAGRVAVCGSSLGGVMAARAAAMDRRFAAVVSDSCIFDLAAHLERHLAATHGQGWELLQWVFGCDDPQGVIEVSRGLAMRDALGRIACPYLVVQGEHDFLGVEAARQAYEFARAQGVAAEWKAFGAQETGAAHCQADNPVVGQEFIWDWVAGRLA